jgi:hypothetical protein
VSDVGSDKCRNTQSFLTKNVKEIFWDMNFLSEVTGCRNAQVPLYLHCHKLYNLFVRTLETGRNASLWRAFLTCFTVSAN